MLTRKGVLVSGPVRLNNLWRSLSTGMSTKIEDRKGQRKHQCDSEHSRGSLFLPPSHGVSHTIQTAGTCVLRGGPVVFKYQGEQLPTGCRRDDPRRIRQN